MQIPQSALIALRRAFGETVDPGLHVPRPASESRLEALLAGCRAGSPVSALVAPPGIGKTHLLRVLEARLRSGAEETRTGATPPGAAASPLGPRRVVYLPYAGLPLPELARWVHGLLGETSPPCLTGAEAEGEALQHLARLGEGPERPLQLLIDDADAMPASTLRAFVQGLPREQSPVRLVLALGDDSRGARLLAALDPIGPREIPYRDVLDEPETEAYLRARLAWTGLDAALLDGLDAKTVTRLRALSGGIPRRLHRVVLALLEPDRAALARALATSSRTDAWLGRPIDDSF